MSDRTGEAGFTLVELLIAVTVLGVIVVSLASAFSVGLNTIDDTSNRLRGSTDAQLLNLALPPDVAAATAVVASADGSGISCEGLAGARLQLSDGVSFDIVYSVRSDAGTHQLERNDCTGGELRSSTVVARNLGSVAAVVPRRLPATGTLTGASLTVTEMATRTSPEPYVFTVTGTRRSS